MATKKIMGESAIRKADTSCNSGDLTECIQRQLKRERNLYPLRINQTTVIYVTKDKQTSEYADWYRRERLKIK